jgi:repressor LexA
MGRPRKLTREQVLDAINGWLVQHGIPPSVEELRTLLRVGSKGTVLRYLEWLEEMGDIERVPGTARGLKSLGTGARGVETRVVPIVGVAPAGPLMLAEDNLEGWVQVPKKMAPARSRYFLLRVRGNSMNEAQVAGEKIEDGDLVLVRQQATADDGEIVVALIDDEATIKRLIRKPSYFVLKPDSTDSGHRPIIVERDFRVQGVVVRVLKKGSLIIQ